MPPKKNPKKGGLSDDEIMRTIGLVKQYWPDYSIEIKNIRNPSREFVLKFYSDCVANMDEMCAFVTKARPPEPPNLSDEEMLFLKMSKIPHLIETGFKLGDLFVFEPKRLSTYMLITMTFLIQIEVVMDKVVAISNRAFNQATELEQDKNEIEKLKINSFKCQIDLTTAREQLKKVSQVAEELAPKYAKVLEAREETKEKCKDKIAEIANIKSQQGRISEEIKRLKEFEFELQKKLVTREEMDNLKTTYDQLLMKEQFFTEADNENSILILKQKLEKMECWLQDLDCLDLPQELYSLADLRTKLKNEKRNISQLATSLESSKTKINQLRNELEEEEGELYKENTSLLDALEKTNKNLMEQYQESQTKYRNMIKSKEKVMQSSEEQLVSKRVEYSTAVTALQEKYNTVVNRHHSLVEDFEHFLNKFNGLMRK